MYPTPVFILASPRSFTSLVCAMLGQHPDAYGVPEINLFASDSLSDFIDTSTGQRQFLMHGLLRLVAQLYAGDQTLESVAMARRWLHRRADQSTADTYRELCERVAPLRIADKSPVYTKQDGHMRRIETAFPDAMYLYLVRNPIDQGRSMMNAPQGVAELLAAESLDFSADPPIIDPQLEWYDTQARILHFLEDIPENRQMHVQGEQLLAEPRRQLAVICEWLRVRFDDAICDEMLKTEDSPYACMGPFGAQWGNNPSFQKSPAFRPRPLSKTSVHGTVPWRDDAVGLSPAIIELAQAFGYE